jgi:RNA polymerase sigma factor (sigma-70 family)
MSASPEPRSRGIDTNVGALRMLEPDRAFERMYRRHASEVYRYALAIVRDAGDAEDVTQTTFLNAFRALQKGERPIKAKSWLIAIAHNVCLQRFRNASRRPQQVVLDEDLADAAVPEETPSADDLVRALQYLSFNQRSALVMRELEGRSYAEIGEILSLPVSAVETLLFRARRALREQLETSITCHEAEELLSRQIDGRLPRGERGSLRAHLRACEECARLARSQRAQRSAWKTLSVVPLPGSLASLFGGGGGAVATGVAAKVAAVGVAAVLVGGGTYEGVKTVQAHVTAKPAVKAVAPVLSAAADEPPRAASAPDHAAAAQKPVKHEAAKAKPNKPAKAAKLPVSHGPPETVVERAGKPAAPPGQTKKAGEVVTDRPGRSAAAEPTTRSRTKTKAAPKKKEKKSPTVTARTTQRGNEKAQAKGQTGAKTTGKQEKSGDTGTTSPAPATSPEQDAPSPGASKKR